MHGLCYGFESIIVVEQPASGSGGGAECGGEVKAAALSVIAAPRATFALP